MMNEKLLVEFLEVLLKDFSTRQKMKDLIAQYDDEDDLKICEELNKIMKESRHENS